MQIKTSEGMHNVASQGLGGTALGLGIAGAASFLGINANTLMGNGCGNNGGGLFGGNRNGNCCEPMETKEASCLREQISILQSQNFSREASTQAFRDSVTYASGLHDKQASNIEKLFDTVIAQGQEIAVLKSDVRCLSVVNEKDHTILRDYTASSVALEAERRAAGDDALACHFNAKLAWKADNSAYIDGQKVFCPDASICGGVLVAGGCTSCANTTKAVKA